MLRKAPFYLVACMLTLGACTRSAQEELCSATFQPYPDLITGRVVQATQLPLLHGMEAYRNGDMEQAADSLAKYLRSPGANKAAHLYLANAYLATGRPYDAELHLDHLERSNLPDYRDQWEWYTVVCWVCSGQLDRAHTGAEQIAKGRRHTYQREAATLLEQLKQSERK